MGAVWMRVRADWRARHRAWIALALIAGVGAGISMATVAGGLRAGSAHPRLIEATGTPDVFLPLFAWGGLAKLDPADVAGLPGVERITRYTVHDAFSETGTQLIVNHAPDFLTDHPPKLLRGRLPSPDAGDEILVPFTYAQEHELDVGDELELTIGGGTTVRIVGVSVSPGDVLLTNSQLAMNGPLAGAAFARDHPLGDQGFRMLGVALEDGVEPTEFERSLEGISGDRPVAFVLRQEDHTALVQRSNRLQSTALWAFAAVVALATAVITQQALSRQIMAGAEDHQALSALGSSRAELSMHGIVRAFVISSIAAVVGVVVAVALSPAFPLGSARFSEPRPGVSVDVLVLTLGAALTIGSMTLAVVRPARRAARRAKPVPRGAGRGSLVGRRAASLGLSVPVTAGIRFALEDGTARGGAPVRATVGGIVLGSAALAMSLTFGASLNNLVASPPLWGGVVDASYYVDEGVEQFVDRVRDDPRVEAFSIGSGLAMQIDGRSLDVLLHKGTLTPPVLEGRAPGGPNVDHEILLGTETLRQLGKTIGDPVRLTIPGVRGSIESVIVGRAVFPALSDTIGLGRGAFHSFVPVAELFGSDVGPVSEISMRFAPGTDRQALLSEYAELFATEGGDGFVDLPRELLNFGEVEHLPLVLSGTLAALAALSLGHLLVGSVSRRRRDLAILATLGFARRQRRRTLGWQALTVTGIGLAIGLPLGVVGGRLLWSLFADRIGFIAVPVVPLLAVLAIAPLALALSRGISIPPAIGAARVRPAVELRSL